MGRGRRRTLRSPRGGGEKDLGVAGRPRGGWPAGLIAGCVSRRSTAPLARPVGANGDIRVAVIGFHSHGKSHIKAYRSIPGVRLVALCDVDEQVLTSEAAELAKENVRVKTFRDL